MPFFSCRLLPRQARVRSAAGNNPHARLFVCLSVCLHCQPQCQSARVCVCVCVCVCGYLACFVALFHRNDPSPPRAHTHALSLSLFGPLRTRHGKQQSTETHHDTSRLSVYPNNTQKTFCRHYRFIRIETLPNQPEFHPSRQAAVAAHKCVPKLETLLRNPESR